MFCRRVLTVLALLLFAASSWSDELVVVETHKIGVEQACSPTLAVTICSSSGSAGIVISAASYSCINVSPPTLITGAGGCATFTVTCGGVDCGGVVNWTAPSHISAQLRYDCARCFEFVIADESSTVVDIGEDMGDMSKVPAVRPAGLVAIMLLIAGVSMVFFARGHRAQDRG